MSVVRIESGLSPVDVQSLVDSLAVTHLPLVEELDGDLVVLATELSAVDRMLVALYHTYPEGLELNVLRAAVKYGNTTRFRKIVEAELRESRVHFKDGSVRLTRKGAAWVESKVEWSP